MALLRKMTCKDKASCASLPPCIYTTAPHMSYIMIQWHIWSSNVHIRSSSVNSKCVFKYSIIIYTLLHMCTTHIQLSSVGHTHLKSVHSDIMTYLGVKRLLCYVYDPNYVSMSFSVHRYVQCVTCVHPTWSVYDPTYISMSLCTVRHTCAPQIWKAYDPNMSVCHCVHFVTYVYPKYHRCMATLNMIGVWPRIRL